MKKLDVVTIGSAVRDVMFYTDECTVINNPTKDPTRKKLMCVEYGAKLKSDNVYFEFGGGAANTAVNFSGLGLRTGIVTSIGEDMDGQSIIHNLKNHYVDTTLIYKTKKHRTGFSFLTIDNHSGERTVHVYYGAENDMQFNTSALKKKKPDWVYVTSLVGKNWKQLMKKVFTVGANVVWNPGSTQLHAGYRVLHTLIQQTTIFNLNKDEATELILTHPTMKKTGNVKQMLHTIHSWGPQVVVITDGQNASYAFDGERVYTQVTPKDTPVNTTGAGDCYGSTFVAGYIRYKGDIQKSMKLASKNATALVHTVGAQRGLLKWSELPQYLR